MSWRAGRQAPSTAGEAAVRAMEYYQMLQCEDGHWAGDYGGPMFLMPGLIFACYITKVRKVDVIMMMVYVDE